MSDPQVVDLARPIRPQSFGRSRPDRIADPVVEPQWPGIRTVAAIGGGSAALFDDAGDSLSEPADVLAAMPGSLAGAGDGAILDGYLTKQVATDDGVQTWVNEYPTFGSEMSRFLVGGARRRAEEAARQREADIRDVTFEPEDPVNLVAVDLLWLDGRWLLDVPLLERKRILESILPGTELVRAGPFVRPPIGTWIGSWRAQGFRGLTFKAANSRYRPGETAPDWSASRMPRR